MFKVKDKENIKDIVYKHVLRKGNGITISKINTTFGAKILSATLVKDYDMKCTISVSSTLWYNKDKGRHWVRKYDGTYYFLNLAFRKHTKEN